MRNLIEQEYWILQMQDYENSNLRTTAWELGKNPALGQTLPQQLGRKAQSCKWKAGQNCKRYCVLLHVKHCATKSFPGMLSCSAVEGEQGCWGWVPYLLLWYLSSSLLKQQELFANLVKQDLKWFTWISPLHNGARKSVFFRTHSTLLIFPSLSNF